jgi:predicted metal-dependent phosphoesterase TrpH
VSPGENATIDLHAHTNESDGTLTPTELVALAREKDLSALAITDHDTFRGYEAARQPAKEAGLELVCGIELNTKMGLAGPHQGRSGHLLAYFPNGGPTESFAGWLEHERAERRDRNDRLATKLQKQGIPITLEEVEARGRSLAGRPHFARLLVEKGYAHNIEEAFGKYLGEGASCFVARQSKTAEEVIGVVRSAGGVPVIAHPIRLDLAPREERELLLQYREAGLIGLEIIHSEQSADLQAHYRQLAEELDLVPSGGSDFHGAVKPKVQLGSGIEGNVRVPYSYLEGLRQAIAPQVSS